MAENRHKLKKINILCMGNELERIRIMRVCVRKEIIVIRRNFIHKKLF